MFKERHHHLGVQYRPHYHLVSGCVGKRSIRFGINYGSVVTDRVSPHYMVIVTGVLR